MLIENLNRVFAPPVGRKSSAAKERLRKRYRPARVRILFIGEAPPASGRFFYQGDSGLYRAIQDTFFRAFPALRKTEFLNSFRGLGCYLVDLCGRPVDRLNNQQRRKVCVAGEVRLSRAIKQLNPEVVVTLVRSIAPNVRRARALANWAGPDLELPYPGRWHHHRDVFRKELIPVLKKYLQSVPRSSRADRV